MGMAGVGTCSWDRDKEQGWLLLLSVLSSSDWKNGDGKLEPFGGALPGCTSRSYSGLQHQVLCDEVGHVHVHLGLLYQGYLQGVHECSVDSDSF